MIDSPINPEIISVLTKSVELISKHGYYDSKDTVLFKDTKPEGFYNHVYDELGNLAPSPNSKFSFSSFVNPYLGEEHLVDPTLFMKQVNNVLTGKIVTQLNVVGAVVCACFDIVGYDWVKVMGTVGGSMGDDAHSGDNGLVHQVFAHVNHELFGFYEKFESAPDKRAFWIMLVGKLTM